MFRSYEFVLEYISKHQKSLSLKFFQCPQIKYLFRISLKYRKGISEERNDLLDRICKMKTDHPIIAHVIFFGCLVIVLGLVEFSTTKSISSFSFVIPGVSFLGWLLESYYKVSSGKLWIIYFFILFAFLTIFDRDSWVNWTSSLIQLWLSAFFATISVLLGRII